MCPSWSKHLQCASWLPVARILIHDTVKLFFFIIWQLQSLQYTTVSYCKLLFPTWILSEKSWETKHWPSILWPYWILDWVKGVLIIGYCNHPWQYPCKVQVVTVFWWIGPGASERRVHVLYWTHPKDGTPHLSQTCQCVSMCGSCNIW